MTNTRRHTNRLEMDERQPPGKLENDDFVIADPLHLRFDGFSPIAFDVLDELRQEPHIGQYRKEKDRIKQYIGTPFRIYRDDLVVNWILPSRLDLETERNVFSRLLKNDFGAGGCHHHLWMSFYRPHLSRLNDVQLSHCIRPEGFSVELFVGAYARKPLHDAIVAMKEDPAKTLVVLNGLRRTGAYSLEWTTSESSRKTWDEEASKRTELPDWGRSTKSIRIRRLIQKSEVVNLGGLLVETTLAAVADLWPLYRLWTRTNEKESAF